jgi:hypothetical protein
MNEEQKKLLSILKQKYEVDNDDDLYALIN